MGLGWGITFKSFVHLFNFRYICAWHPRTIHLQDHRHVFVPHLGCDKGRISSFAQHPTCISMPSLIRVAESYSGAFDSDMPKPVDATCAEVTAILGTRVSTETGDKYPGTTIRSLFVLLPQGDADFVGRTQERNEFLPFQRVNGGGEQVNGSLASFCLGCFKPVLDGEIAADGYRPCVEIDVFPRQGAEFTMTQAGVHSEGPKVNRLGISRGVGDQPFKLIKFKWLW